jgi:hypothetical protein
MFNTWFVVDILSFQKWFDVDILDFPFGKVQLFWRLNEKLGNFLQIFWSPWNYVSNGTAHFKKCKQLFE